MPWAALFPNQGETPGECVTVTSTQSCPRSMVLQTEQGHASTFASLVRGLFSVTNLIYLTTGPQSQVQESLDSPFGPRCPHHEEVLVPRASTPCCACKGTFWKMPRARAAARLTENALSCECRAVASVTDGWRLSPAQLQLHAGRGQAAGWVCLEGKWKLPSC